ncbi:MAG TPA: hypothetical protein VK688_02440, partial [Gemmatimonadales bacterium]|nr:hypothetical protein [Gemmatimonadales bacterium]
RYRTPHVAIWLYAVVTCVLATTGTFEHLLILANVASLVVYLMAALATLELRRRRVRLDAPPFVLPGGPLIPLLACGVVIWLLANAERREWLSVGAMLGVATLLFFAADRRPRPAAAQEPPAP